MIVFVSLENRMSICTPSTERVDGGSTYLSIGIRPTQNLYRDRAIGEIDRWVRVFELHLRGDLCVLETDDCFDQTHQCRSGFAVANVALNRAYDQWIASIDRVNGLQLNRIASCSSGALRIVSGDLTLVGALAFATYMSFKILYCRWVDSYFFVQGLHIFLLCFRRR